MNINKYGRNMNRETERNSATQLRGIGREEENAVSARIKPHPATPDTTLTLTFPAATLALARTQATPHIGTSTCVA